MTQFPASRNAAAPHRGHADPMPPRCLLVDDSQAFLHAASRPAGAGGPHGRGGGLQHRRGAAQARALRPDLILVDIGLGDESGFELARLLAQDPQDGRRADVILISAAAQTDYQDLIHDSPAAGFLAKSDLSARAISHILSHTPHSPPKPRPISTPPPRPRRPTQPAQRVRVAASRGSAGKGSGGQRWAFAVMAGAQPREILGGQGATAPESQRASPRGVKVAWLMNNTSQGLLQRQRDAVGTDWRNHAACRDVDPDLFFPSVPQVPLCFRSKKPSRYAERARCPHRVCGGRWTAATLVSGAAPRRTNGAPTGGCAHYAVKAAR